MHPGALELNLDSPPTFGGLGGGAGILEIIFYIGFLGKISFKKKFSLLKKRGGELAKHRFRPFSSFHRWRDDDPERGRALDRWA